MPLPSGLFCMILGLLLFFSLPRCGNIRRIDASVGKSGPLFICLSTSFPYQIPASQIRPPIERQCIIAPLHLLVGGTSGQYGLMILFSSFTLRCVISFRVPHGATGLQEVHPALLFAAWRVTTTFMPIVKLIDYRRDSRPRYSSRRPSFFVFIVVFSRRPAVRFPPDHVPRRRSPLPFIGDPYGVPPEPI